MEPQSTKVPKKPSKGYGKRPLWHWIVLYIVLGAIVYGLVYYFMSSAAGSGY